MQRPVAGGYVVFVGRQLDIYKTWDECKRLISGFSKARFNKFGAHEEAYNAWTHDCVKEADSNQPNFGARSFTSSF